MADSQYLSFDENSFPRALKQLVSPSMRCHSHYSVMDHFHAHHTLVEPTEAAFHYYRRIDTGEGIDDDWPIQLKHPSKCNVKVTDDLYDEIQLFCTATFDDVVYVSHRIDKFGRCYVNGTTYSSDYNSTDRASVVKSMFWKITRISSSDLSFRIIDISQRDL